MDRYDQRPGRANSRWNGWYWSYYDSNPEGKQPPVPQAVDNDQFPFAYPNSDFGITGPLSVEVTLYYQSIPPTYLKDRFDSADGPATKRLHFLGSHMLESPEITQWKLKIAETSRIVP